MEVEGEDLLKESAHMVLHTLVGGRYKWRAQPATRAGKKFKVQMAVLRKWPGVGPGLAS